MDSNNIEKLELQRHAHSPQPQNKGTTFITTCFNGLNALTGIGILSIPYALSEGGWTSLTALFMICLVCLYTGLLLKRCMDTNPLIKTYPDIGAQAFGRKGRAVISIFMYLELFLLAVEFLILEGDNLHKLFPNFCVHVFGKRVGGKQAFILLTALVMLPTTWLRNLSLLAYVSAGGILASVVLVATVSWIGAVEGVGFGEREVLLVCFILSTINYGSMAILGYLMYEDNVMSQVTLNLPTRNTSSKIAIYTTLNNPVTKYAIIVTPIATALEETLILRDSRDQLNDQRFGKSLCKLSPSSIRNSTASKNNSRYMKMVMTVLPFRPNACAPMSGYVLMRGFVSMHLFRSKPVYKQTRHIMKRAVKDVQPPSDSAYGIDSMPMPANTRIVLIELQSDVRIKEY
ncbi:UNVERIFIED_CONTAM: Amino acid transporter AVT1I [Sesamum radiatum]|uniref:Amino acid transporter AVT1I n=1 Tax=Sesamum radiatum TaxID=300843 RepID=A0AAW2MZV9_SESRA